MIGKLVKAGRAWIEELLGAARFSHEPGIGLARCEEEVKGEFGFSVTLSLWLSSALPLLMLRVSGDRFFAFLWMFALLFTFLARSRQRFFERYLASPKLAHTVFRRR